jgi:hypothetical protein
MEEETKMLKNDDDRDVETDVLAPPDDANRDGCAGTVDGNRVKAIEFPLHQDAGDNDNVLHSHANHEDVLIPPLPDDFASLREEDPNDGSRLDPEKHSPVIGVNPHVLHAEGTTHAGHLLPPPEAVAAEEDTLLGHHMKFHPGGGDAMAPSRSDPAGSRGWEIVVQPTDVILGRGKGFDYHRGNQMFKGKRCFFISSVERDISFFEEHIPCNITKIAHRNSLFRLRPLLTQRSFNPTSLATWTRSRVTKSGKS